MSPFPRFRQACRRDNPGSVDAAAETRVWQGPGASASAPLGHPSHAGAAGALRAQDELLAVNRLFLSGVLAADPVEDKDLDGNPVTLLLIVFTAPDSGKTRGLLMREIEVPEGVTRRHGKTLRAGDWVYVSGQLNGGDSGIVATEIRQGPPLGEEVGAEGNCL